MLLCLKIKLQMEKFIFIMLKVMFVLYFLLSFKCFWKGKEYIFTKYIITLCSFTFYGIEYHELNRTKISLSVSCFSYFQMCIEPCAKVVFSFAENNKIGSVRCHVTGSHGEALYTDISSMVLIWNALMAGKNQSFHFCKLQILSQSNKCCCN